MSAVVEVWEQFTKGRKTRRGRPAPAAPELVVTLVAPDAIDDFLGAVSRGEREAHLRRLRDEGLLMHDCDHRLTQTVQGQGLKRAYAFRCREAEVPRLDPGARRSSGVGDVFNV